MIAYVNSRDRDTAIITQIFEYGYLGLALIVLLVLLIIELRWIRESKDETYRCLIALPKSVVSQLCENLRVLKRDAASDGTGHSSEMNKQDETILKIFSNAETGDSKMGGLAHFVACAIASFGLVAGMAFVVGGLLSAASAEIYRGAPHLDNLLGSYAYQMALFTSIQHLTCENETCWTNGTLTLRARIDAAHAKMEQVRYYWHLMRFGGPSAGETPFERFESILEEERWIITDQCPEPLRVFSGFDDARTCMPIDLQFVLVEPAIRARLEPFDRGVWPNMRLRTDPVWTSLWQLMIQPVYEHMFVRMFESIIERVDDVISQKRAITDPFIAVFAVLGAVVEVLAFMELNNIEAHIRSVLRLLLHCPSDVIASTPKITAVLSGDFSAAKSDSALRNARFFDSVFVSLPEAIMYTDSSKRVIEGANAACVTLFGGDPMDGLSSPTLLIGANVGAFYNGDNFYGDVAALSGTPPQKVTLMKKVDGSEMYYEVEMTLSNEKLVISAQDVTQTVRYNTLVAEERAKSDELLASILPPSLVKRVQQGEKNISFAIQSASISFMDIVEFTPWCGSLTAAKVMSTLNNLFKRFDECVAKRATMTKIKCIGDCYVSAGGIFSEVNQPTVHTKEMVSFGLEAIQCLEDLDKELDENLRIRVGVNTGGPVVAGVLGVGKPTFEILGPTINLAQQMEHHGVPMQVHVTRAVYELIYGDATFQVRERGQTQINTGSVITYLVSPK
jgi:class 3 adenylate cyclase